MATYNILPPDSCPLTPDPCPLTPGHRPAYTLVEILTATVLMLVIMMAVTVVFATVTDSIAESRATLEMNQRLRSTAATLKQDLANVTAPMAPPLQPRQGKGYFQYVEGPIGPVIDPAAVAWNSELQIADTTVGDIDDILMFTVKTKGEPYIGLINGQPATSDSAEIIWFIRGTTLYRRVLLVNPAINVRAENPAGFYQRYDLSVRKAWDYESVPVTLPPGPPYDPADGEHRPVLAANSLADLTRPECRFAHQPNLAGWLRNPVSANVVTPGPDPTPFDGFVPTTMFQRDDSDLRYWKEPKPFPFFLRPWLGAPYDIDPATGSERVPITADFRWVPGLGLPILAECSDPDWRAGDALPSENTAGVDRDADAFALGTPPSFHLRVQMPRIRSSSDTGELIEPIDWYDAWLNPHPWRDANPLTGALVAQVENAATDQWVTIGDNGTRIGEDVVMTNVIGFDVKAWDPNAPVLRRTIAPTGVVLMPGDPDYLREMVLLQDAIVTGSAYTTPPIGAYADLNYLARLPLRPSLIYPDVDYGTTLPALHFHRQGNPLMSPTNEPLACNRSMAYGTRLHFAVYQQPYCFFPSVYDTWSLHFEHNGQRVHYFTENPSTVNYEDSLYVGDEDGNGIYDQASNGLDDDNQNGVDDPGERETQPPYAVPLQGIQVRIRAFEPGSRQIREVTIIQKFKTQ